MRRSMRSGCRHCILVMPKPLDLKSENRGSLPQRMPSSSTRPLDGGSDRAMIQGSGWPFHGECRYGFPLRFHPGRRLAAQCVLPSLLLRWSVRHPHDEEPAFPSAAGGSPSHAPGTSGLVPPCPRNGRPEGEWRRLQAAGQKPHPAEASASRSRCCRWFP
jgi:hypothetical protein